MGLEEIPPHIGHVPPTKTKTGGAGWVTEWEYTLGTLKVGLRKERNYQARKEPYHVFCRVWWIQKQSVGIRSTFLFMLTAPTYAEAIKAAKHQANGLAFALQGLNHAE